MKKRIAMSLLCAVVSAGIMAGITGGVTVMAEETETAAAADNTFEAGTEGKILESGKCGDSVYYQIIQGTTIADVSLRIYGTGRMADYEMLDAPWQVQNSLYGTGSTDIEIEDGVTYIGDNAFAVMPRVGEVHIPETVTEIGDNAFTSMHYLRQVTIPASVEKIGEQAFFSMASLETVTFAPGSHLQTIGARAFGACKELTGNVTIPDSVTEIGDGAFYQDEKISSVTLGAGVQSIGKLAFGKCSSLPADITIPEQVSLIDEGAFTDTPVSSATFQGDAPDIEKAAFPQGTILYYNTKKAGWGAPTVGGYAAYPIGTDPTNPSDPGQKTPKDLLFSSDGVSIYYKGNYQESTGSWKVRLYITNDSSQEMIVEANDTYVNDSSINTLFRQHVQPGETASSDITLLKPYLQRNGIVSLDSMRASFKIITSNYRTIAKSDLLDIPVSAYDNLFSFTENDGMTIRFGKQQSFTYMGSVGIRDAELTPDSRVSFVPEKTDTVAEYAKTSFRSYAAKNGLTLAQIFRPAIAVYLDGVKRGTVTDTSLEDRLSIETAAPSSIQKEGRTYVWFRYYGGADELGRWQTGTVSKDFSSFPALAIGYVTEAPDVPTFGWLELNGKSYWYENSTRQGTVNDPKGVRWKEDPPTANRGREIYDPSSDAWYWLDSNADGAKATGKEVFMPYVYQDEKERQLSDEEMRSLASASDAGMQEFVYQDMKNGSGKWVRYDGEGRMLKGWVTITGDLAAVYPDQRGNTYYYDEKTGAMAKGNIMINGRTYHFDEVTGVLVR